MFDALRRGEPYDRWLLVFDNADQPEEISDLIPRGPGQVIITSRNHQWQGIVDTVEFLSRRASLSDSDADRLAEQLGDLPLALEQAGRDRLPAGNWTNGCSPSTSPRSAIRRRRPCES
ncbi:hypothetical protein [Nonomuraea sp. NPDC050540]|uniref:hypothetical protein n=1 Tax=Nonomuraea sp. NPDC050540 TaxID=3364367 RepID=UPI0037BD71BC